MSGGTGECTTKGTACVIINYTLELKKTKAMYSQWPITLTEQVEE